MITVDSWSLTSQPLSWQPLQEQNDVSHQQLRPQSHTRAQLVVQRCNVPGLLLLLLLLLRCLLIAVICN
jgi:hypothetical protein